MKAAANLLLGAVLLAGLLVTGFVLWVEYQAFIGSNPFQ